MNLSWIDRITNEEVLNRFMKEDYTEHQNKMKGQDMTVDAS